MRKCARSEQKGIGKAMWLYLFLSLCCSVDVLAQNNDTVNDLSSNEQTEFHAWLKILLEVKKSETKAIGSEIKIVADGKTYTKEVTGSPLDRISNNSEVTEFNLGTAKKVDSLIIYWNGGDPQVLVDLEVNQLIQVKEGAISTMRIDLIAGGIFLVLLLIYFVTRKQRDESTKLFPF